MDSILILRDHVAADYGISGPALAKIRRKLDVPVPPRGYWARHAAKTAPDGGLDPDEGQERTRISAGFSWRSGPESREGLCRQFSMNRHHRDRVAIRHLCEHGQHWTVRSPPRGRPLAARP